MRMHDFCPDNKNANDCSLKLGLSFMTGSTLLTVMIYTRDQIYFSCYSGII